MYFTHAGTEISRIAHEPELETAVNLLIEHPIISKELETAVLNDGTLDAALFDRNDLLHFEERSMLASAQASDDVVHINVPSEAAISGVDQKRGSLNGPRRGRKLKEKLPPDERVVIAGWKGREVPEYIINGVKKIDGDQADLQDPKLEARGENRKTYFSLIENFLNFQDGMIGGSDQRAVHHESKDQTSGQADIGGEDFLCESEQLLMEGLFASQRSEETNKLGGIGSEISGKQLESIAGNTLEEIWLNEPQRLYCGSAYETLSMGEPWQDLNQVDSYLMLTSQSHKMELLELQLQENLKHIKKLEDNSSSSLFIGAYEGQPYAPGGILANERSAHIKLQKQAIQSSSCSTDIAPRSTPGLGQFFFPGRRLVDFQNTGVSVMPKDDERSLDLQCKGMHKHYYKGGPRRQWSSEEDRKLKELVEKYGQQRWSHIATFLQGRKGKQCRERWLNHLRSNIKRDEWTEKEEVLLISLHDKYENRWAEIAKHIPGRPENAIKNHWNATKRRRDLRNKSRKATNGSSDGLEVVQRSMVLRNYLQTHLIDENMKSSKKSRKSGNPSDSVDLLQETVDSSTSLSYDNENSSQLDLSSTRESNSSNIEAIAKGTYKSAKCQEVELPDFYCCPPALISCEEDIAVAFQGHDLSGSIFHGDTRAYASVKDRFASSPSLSEFVRSCRDDHMVDQSPSVVKTSTSHEPDMSHRLRGNEKSSNINSVSDVHDQVHLSAHNINQRDFTPWLEDPVQGNQLPVHDSRSMSTGALAVYPSQNLSIIPQGQVFQILLADTAYGYCGQAQQAITSQMYTHTDYDQLYHIDPESSALPTYHSMTQYNEWMRPDPVNQISDECIDERNKQELDLIELVTLS
ncbi:hypothetical protein O6H91_11G113300 [Diphasiastrum complanatum]|uniref:Uncharacterized protein n=1 Tax=Diphasiastrum complanatum TaxID=34168 RepID=A0ACC2CD29_DIPCM|nr:hypothetical protein O6H91_11G113300 [Diphasiastrum complanatum]